MLNGPGVLALYRAARRCEQAGLDLALAGYHRTALMHEWRHAVADLYAVINSLTDDAGGWAAKRSRSTAEARLDELRGAAAAEHAARCGECTPAAASGL